MDILHELDLLMITQNEYYPVGGTVVPWLALLPHGK